MPTYRRQVSSFCSLVCNFTPLLWNSSQIPCALASLPYTRAGLTDAAAITKSLQLLMLLLPPSHRIVAQHLLQFLSLVVSSRLQSKMDEHNLALVFAPTLFLSSNMARDPSSVRTLEKLVSLLQYMIRNPLEIFEVKISNIHTPVQIFMLTVAGTT